ncbi:hypothetical protein ACFQBQ_08745 [Granulicella cerasi]|uniref:Uncharacterized protein n=1 Tax=Granulicella cerasi TaxID=741063 RepID=A0ABW1Z8Y6_9BACT|nr:hypothetical protein [Granulicella cerasi]
MSTLMDAPNYDPTRDRLIKSTVISVVTVLIVGFFFTFAGYVLGHGWAFSNIPTEHRVNKFFNALEAKDYKTAYALYENDENWEQHPSKFGYPLPRFIEDWTTHSPVNGPITQHHVDISKTDGTGNFGTGTIVAVRVNGTTKVFMYVNRADGTMTWPAPHVLEYN